MCAEGEDSEPETGARSARAGNRKGYRYTGILFAEILQLLCKHMSQKEVEALWRDSKLSWADFLPETVDVNNFITEQTTQGRSHGMRVETISPSKPCPDPRPNANKNIYPQSHRAVGLFH
ncbi:eukaryotic translation initiation factor 4 gamma 3 isoform X5 [Silurus meridionalis]|nr:eukaryotic translation initiation factor 4 gamma 3 isoform X5 [Silurus meridionalis]